MHRQRVARVPAVAPPWPADAETSLIQARRRWSKGGSGVDDSLDMRFSGSAMVLGEQTRPNLNRNLPG